MGETDDLARVVAEMREAQQEYFRTRSHDSLRRSKALEARVDKMLEAPRPQAQADLFTRSR